MNMTDDVLNYATVADLEAAGWTVVESGGGTLSIQGTDTDGAAHVVKGSVHNDGAAYIKRTFTVVPGRTYTATARMKNTANIAFDTGAGLTWSPGPGVSVNDTAWQNAEVSYVPSGSSVEIRVGRFGGFFGIAGTYGALAHPVKVSGGGGAGVTVEWAA